MTYEEELAELAAAGVGEGDFGGNHHVPSDALELYEVMEWENGVAHTEGREIPHPDVYIPGADP